MIASPLNNSDELVSKHSLAAKAPKASFQEGAHSAQAARKQQVKQRLLSTKVGQVDARAQAAIEADDSFMPAPTNVKTDEVPAEKRPKQLSQQQQTATDMAARVVRQAKQAPNVAAAVPQSTPSKRVKAQQVVPVLAGAAEDEEECKEEILDSGK